jgi:hypothetical protein
MRASQLSTPSANEATPSVPIAGVDSSHKAVGKTTTTNFLSSKDSQKNSPPLASGTILTLLLPALVLVPAASDIVSGVAPQESPAASSSSPTGAMNAGNIGSIQSGPVSPATSSGFPALSPATVPSMNPALSVTSPDGAKPMASPFPQLNNDPPQASSPAPNFQAGNSSSDLSGMQIAENTPPAPQDVDQPATSVASPATVSVQDAGTASQVAVGQPTGDAVLSAISAIAGFVSVAPQGTAASESNRSPAQSKIAGAPQASPDIPSASTDPSPQNLNPSGVLSPDIASQTIPRTVLKQSSLQPPAPETLPAAAKQNPLIASNLLSPLHTPGNDPMAPSRDQQGPTPSPSDAALSPTQPANPSPVFFVDSFFMVPPTTSAEGANPVSGTSRNAGKNGLASSGAGSAVFSGPVALTVTAKGVANNAQSGSSGGDTPDPSAQKGPTVGSVQPAGPLATSPQSATTAQVDPALQAAIQGTTGQPAASPGFAHKSDSGSPAGPDAPSNLPANLPASGELPVNPSAGPVQMAQMVNRAAQSEMRIGLNTSAFGNVEVRTVVHANEVGVLIGSEKGDLRSLLANELPGIANTLQQLNLRLNQVNFHQQGFAFSNQMSSGSDSQPRSFASRPMSTKALSAPMSSAESSEPAEPANPKRGRGLSILA